MHHSSFAPRLLAMSLLAASALSVSAFAAPVSSSTAIRADRDPPTNASSSVSASRALSASGFSGTKTRQSSVSVARKKAPSSGS